MGLRLRFVRANSSWSTFGKDGAFYHNKICDWLSPAKQVLSSSFSIPVCAICVRSNLIHIPYQQNVMSSMMLSRASHRVGLTVREYILQGQELVDPLIGAILSATSIGPI